MFDNVEIWNDRDDVNSGSIVVTNSKISDSNEEK